MLVKSKSYKSRGGDQMKFFIDPMRLNGQIRLRLARKVSPDIQRDKITQSRTFEPLHFSDHKLP